MNAGTVIVAVVVIVIIGLAIRSVVKKKGSHCADCSGCSHQGLCSPDSEATYERFKAAMQESEAATPADDVRK